MGAIKQVVVMVLVPLLGLGSHHVKKFVVAEHNIKAHYIDEHQGMDAVALRDCTGTIDDNEMAITTIIPFVSPSSLATNKLSGKPPPGFALFRK